LNLDLDGAARVSHNSLSSDSISAMLSVYQETIRSILNQSDHPGISAEELELFKSQFRASAYTCRLKSCPRATLGFETEQSRHDHELAHVRKFRCTFPDCHFPPFLSAQALKGHANKYHNPNPAPKSIRNIQTPSAPRRSPTHHDEGSNKPTKKRRRKSSLILMDRSDSNATLSEENMKPLNNIRSSPLNRSKAFNPSSLKTDSPNLPTGYLPNGLSEFEHSFRQLKQLETAESWDQSKRAPIDLLGVAKQTRNPSLEIGQNSLILPSPFKEGFRPEPWRQSNEAAMSKAMQAQRVPSPDSVYPSSAGAIPNAPAITPWRPRMDWVRNNKSNFAGNPRAHKDELLLHQNIQEPHPHIAGVGSRHTEMNHLEHPASITGVHVSQIPMAIDGYFGSRLRGYALGGPHTILLAGESNEQHPPNQSNQVAGINRDIGGSSDNDSDETLDNCQKEKFDMMLYCIVMDVMELPAHFPGGQLGMPSIFTRWEDLWLWMSQHPELALNIESLCDMQYQQLRQKLLHEAIYSLTIDGIPIFAASNLEFERMRNNKQWCEMTNPEIFRALSEFKRMLWIEMRNGTDGPLCELFSYDRRSSLSFRYVHSGVPHTPR
jgi:hypothetical protein